jgi:hypothetical protein
MRTGIQFVLHASLISSAQKCIFIHFMINGYSNLIADKAILLNCFAHYIWNSENECVYIFKAQWSQYIPCDLTYRHSIFL